MLTEFDDGELAADDALRGRQEREIALGHSLTNAEYELAREAVAVGRTLQSAGIAFDPLTFVALRIVEGSRDEHVNAIDCLTSSRRSGSWSGRSRLRSICSKTRRERSNPAPGDVPSTTLRA